MARVSESASCRLSRVGIANHWRRDEAWIVGMGVDSEHPPCVRRTRADTRQDDRLRRGALINAQAGNWIQRWRQGRRLDNCRNRHHRDSKRLADEVVAGPAVIHRDRQGCGSQCIGDWRKRQSAGAVRGGVIDRWHWNDGSIAGDDRNDQVGVAVGRTCADAGQVDGLQTGILIERQVGDGIQCRRQRRLADCRNRHHGNRKGPALAR